MAPRRRNAPQQTQWLLFACICLLAFSSILRAVLLVIHDLR